MSTEENKALILRGIEALNRRNMAEVFAIVEETFFALPGGNRKTETRGVSIVIHWGGISACDLTSRRFVLG